MLLTVMDDGTGIADPATLLQLGGSGWGEDMLAREDPAGMGFFSLAGRKVGVSTRTAGLELGWSARIEPDAWTSGSAIAVRRCARLPGTTITTHVPTEWLDKLPNVVANAARHYPLTVIYNGERQQQVPFLATAVHVESFAGLRIGVYCDRWDRRDTLNFHGLAVRHQLPAIQEVWNQCRWHARVDIDDCPALQLTLPARKEVVASPFLADLDRAVLTAIFRAIARVGTHRLCHADWVRARDLGVDLPEALPELMPFSPKALDSSLDQDWNATPRMAKDQIVVGRYDPAYEQSLARAVAVSGWEHADRVVRVEPAFNGYRWYDELGFLVAMTFVLTIDERIIIDTPDAPAELDPAQRCVQAITAEVTIAGEAGTEHHQLATDLVMQRDDECDIDRAGFAVVAGSAGTGHILTGSILAQYLDRAYFSSSDDRDQDSFDTQLREWQRASLALAVRTLEGAAAAIRTGIELAFYDYVRWLVPAGMTLELRYQRHDVDITITPEPASAPVADGGDPPCA